MPIVQVDPNTYALWWMDEASHAVGLADETGTASPMTYSSNYTTHPAYTPGPNGIGLARVGNISQSTFAVDSDAPGVHAALFYGEVTISCFVRWDVNAGVAGNIFCYSVGGVGVGSEGFNFYITSAGKIGLFWEYGISNAVNKAQSAGSSLAVGVWAHIAAVVRHLPTSPLTGQVEFWIDGVLQDTAGFTRGAPNPDEDHDGGTAALLGLFSDFNVALVFPGSVKDIKLQSGASSGGYIAADAALMNTTAEQVRDGGTLLLFRLQDQPDAVDQCGRCPLVAPDAFEVLPTLPLTNDTASNARSKVFGGGSVSSVLRGPIGPIDYNIGLATLFRGNCSIDGWIKAYPESGTNIEHGILLLNSVADESQDGNFFAVALIFNSQANGYSVRLNWESGAGTDQSWISAINTIQYYEMISARGIHLGITKTVTGSDAVIRLYINGVLKETSPNITNYDGTMNTASAQFLLGSAYNFGFKGALDEWRLSSSVRTAQEFLDIYMAGTDAIPPVITLISPTNLSTINKDNTIVVDVTDRTGFSGIVIETSYAEGILQREVVHDGTDFSDNFLGVANVKSAITNGFRFTMLRDGNWPANALSMKVIAIDATGLSATAEYSWTVNATVQQAYRYLMRAFNTVPTNDYMYWMVDDAPDTSAASSPYPGSASDIVVVGVFCKRDTL